MRKLLIAILLASVFATPALAAPSDFAGRQAARAERQQARSDARAERQQSRDDARSQRSNDRSSSFSRPDRPGRSGDAQAQSFSRPDRIQPSDRPGPVNIDAARSAIDNARTSRDSARMQRIEQRQQVVDQRQQQTMQRIQENRDLRQSTRPLPKVLQTRVPVVSETPREGTQPPMPTAIRTTAAPAWSTSWRHNSKYDWYNWRKKHRSWFRLGLYYDPFGWGYYPYQIGWRLWPSYYSSRYWINDPWQYRLPYAPPGYVWIRYWNDALLVDTWSGQVVDVIPNFFW